MYFQQQCNYSPTNISPCMRSRPRQECGQMGSALKATQCFHAIVPAMVDQRSVLRVGVADRSVCSPSTPGRSFCLDIISGSPEWTNPLGAKNKKRHTIERGNKLYRLTELQGCLQKPLCKPSWKPIKLLPCKSTSWVSVLHFYCRNLWKALKWENVAKKENQTKG